MHCRIWARALPFAVLTLLAVPCGASVPGTPEEETTVRKALYVTGVLAALEIACKFRDRSDYIMAKVFLDGEPGGFTGSRYSAAFADGTIWGSRVAKEPNFPAICLTTIPNAIKVLRKAREVILRTPSRFSPH
jgi:hypothetical protein